MKKICAAIFAALFVTTLASPALAQGEIKPPPRPTPVPATAADGPEFKKMRLVAEGTVKEIVKSDTILLDNNKRYRLDNVRVPLEFDHVTLEWLKKTALDRQVKLYSSRKEEESVDRYGVLVVQMIRDDGMWVQGDMVQQGLSWAYSSYDGRNQVKVLLAKEKEARQEQRGFWYSPNFAVRHASNVEEDINSYQIVEGKVLSVTIKNDTAFFNFGPDWQTDFTITVDGQYWPLFGSTLANRVTAENWANHKIRVHGWVEDKNGPMIDVTHPEQIELIDKEKQP